MGLRFIPPPERVHKTCALMLARELSRRQIDPLPLLVAAKMLDVPG
jgi:hypothetical protein